MEAKLLNYLDQIREIQPEIVIETVDLNQDGLVNDVVVINNQWVFRFGKIESAAKILSAEIRVLKLAQPYLSVKIPVPIYESSNIVGYPYLPGNPLTLKALRMMDRTHQEKLARDLGRFLTDLHNIPVEGKNLPLTFAPVTYEKWVELRARIEKAIYPLLLPHQVQWCQDLLDSALKSPSFFKYSSSLIHGDLASYHILFDESGLCGVIDFGVAGIGDPATDVAGLINQFGETFVSTIRPYYPLYDQTIQRARFYAQAIELQWVMLGVESGENYWFTAHLGNARDILI